MAGGMDDRIRELEMKVVGLSTVLQQARKELRDARLETGTVVYIVMDQPPHSDVCVFTRFEDAVEQAKVFFRPRERDVLFLKRGAPEWDKLKPDTEYWDTGDEDYEEPPSVVVRRETMRGVIQNWLDRHEEECKRERAE